VAKGFKQFLKKEASDSADFKSAIERYVKLARPYHFTSTKVGNQFIDNICLVENEKLIKNLNELSIELQQKRKLNPKFVNLFISETETINRILGYDPKYFYRGEILDVFTRLLAKKHVFLRTAENITHAREQLERGNDSLAETLIYRNMLHFI